VRAEGRLSERGERDCYGHQAFQQLGEEKLKLKSNLELKLQTLKYVQATQLQQQNDQTSIILQLQQLDWIFHARAIQCKREKITQGTE
jgi:hypothetical protein